MEGLGRLYNARLSTTTAALTVSLKDCGGVTIFGTATSSGDVTFTQRTAADAGGSSLAYQVTRWYGQTSGVWALTTQAADDAFAMNVTLWAVEISAASLADGYKYVTASAAAGTLLLVQHDLNVQRKPANLADIRA
jgi:hypothetical protein